MSADTESAPLLSHDVANPQPTQEPQTPPSKFPISRVIYFMTLHFLIAFAEMVLVAPLLRLEERSLCIQHYSAHDPSMIGPGGDVPEELCKGIEVQIPLWRIRGLKSFLDTIPVFLVAIPLGNLGDHFGRRRIMTLSLFGVALSMIELFVICAFPLTFSLKWIYLSSFILLCGGGLYSTAAFMWAMASESFSEEQRSRAFYYIFSAFYIAELVASYLAFLTTNISPWIPCGMALGTVILCILILLLLPQPKRSPIEADITPNQSARGTSNISSSSLSSLLKTLKPILSKRNVLLLIPVFLVGTLRYTTLSIMLTYASVRFKMYISHGALFFTETAAINIFLFLFLIPRLSTYLIQTRHVKPQVIDLYLVYISVACLSIGALCIGLAPIPTLLPVGVAIFAAGFGSRVSALSLISYWIPDESKATLYAAIAVLENLGHAVGDPSMAFIYSRAITMPESRTGLSFFTAAFLYALAGFSSAFIKLDDSNGDVQEPLINDSISTEEE